MCAGDGAIRGSEFLKVKILQQGGVLLCVPRRNEIISY